MPLTRAQFMEVPGGPGVIGAIKAGSGIVISPDGTISTSGDGGSIPPGSKVPFYQASAPTGWTIDTSVNDSAVRIVSSGGGGGGGSTSFSSAFSSYSPSGSVSSSGNCTPQGNVSLSGLSVSGISVNGNIGSTSLSNGQGPVHAHRSRNDGQFWTDANGSQSWRVNGGGNDALLVLSGNYTFEQCFGEGHSHSFSGSASGGSVSGNANFSGSNTPVTVTSTFSGQSTSQFAVKYVNMIICVKS